MDDWELKLLGKKGAAPFTPSGKLSLKFQLDLQMYSKSLGFLNFSLDLDPLLTLVWQLLFNTVLELKKQKTPTKSAHNFPIDDECQT